MKIDEPSTTSTSRTAWGVAGLRSAALAGVVALTLSTAVVTGALAGDAVNMEVTGEGVRMREAPNAQAPSVRQLRKGDLVTQIGQPNGRWCKVSVGRVVGYTACQFLRATGDDPHFVADAAEDAFEARDAGESEPEADAFVNDGGAVARDEAEPPGRPGPAPDRSGLFLRLHGGLGIGNFTLTGDSESGDSGSMVELNLGATGTSGWGIGVGLSQTEFAYQNVLFSAIRETISGVEDEEIDVVLNLYMVDVSGWGFFDISRNAVLHVRLGLGYTAAGFTTRIRDTSDDSVGLVAGLGTTLYPFDNVGLSLEAAWRSYGLALRLGGEETSELSTFGLTLGVMFR